jgi:hypothetical protein
MEAKETVATVGEMTVAQLKALIRESVEEILRDLFKYRYKEPRKVIALGGLWKDIDFDVTDAEVRAFRQEVTARILEKV